MSNRPLIGITVDNRDNTAASGKYECSLAYAQAVADAGGLPILLPHHPRLVPDYLHHCRALVLTGGGDPVTEPFGQSTDPRVKRMDPDRQTFELALLDAAESTDLPVLGICLGMQLMGLRAGGQFDQHLPDTLGQAAAAHQKNREHSLVFEIHDSHITPAEGTVVSWHNQALRSSGSMRTIARAPDGVIEAIDDPDRLFCLGVQWHPERIAPDRSPELNRQLFHHLVEASRRVR